MPRVAASPEDLDRLLANASFWRNVTTWIGAPQPSYLKTLALTLTLSP